MKLVVEVELLYDSRRRTHRVSGGAYLKADREDDIVRENFNQAEEVAQLIEIAKEIQRVVNAYDLKDSGFKPIVLRKSSTEPLTE